MSVSKALKVIGWWSNRANDAYAMGEADWAANGFVMKLASDCYDGTEESLKRLALQLPEYCTTRGIDPKRHKWHGR
jgi:hypothetical protein